MLTAEKGRHKLSGIFTTEFTSNKNLRGSGVAVFVDNALYGGDAAYHVKGRYGYSADKSISANVLIVDYSGNENSVFGPVKSGRLTLKGTFNPEGFTLSGYVKGKPDFTIVINLRKLEGLAEG